MAKSLVLFLTLAVGMGWGQITMTATSGTTTFLVAPEPQPPKDMKCAYDLKPQLIEYIPERKPSKTSLMFPRRATNFAISVYTDPYEQKFVCPYERAIALFGDERVTFEEYTKPPTADEWKQASAPGNHYVQMPEKMKRVKVDGEVVYEEPRKE